MLASLFGNETAEKVLLYLQNYGEGYAREIAAAYEIPLLSVQRQLQKLENGGILVSKALGRTRMFYFNPRNYFLPELKALLEKELGALPQREIQRYYRNRARPRRTGKTMQ